MGTWGPGGFENDAALGVVAEFATSDDLAALFDSLPEDADEPVDADKARAVVAAAECVAALLDRPAGDLPDALASTLKGFGTPEPELVESAREALSGVLSWSELADLWRKTTSRPSISRLPR